MARVLDAGVRTLCMFVRWVSRAEIMTYWLTGFNPGCCDCWATGEMLTIFRQVWEGLLRRRHAALDRGRPRLVATVMALLQPFAQNNTAAYIFSDGVAAEWQIRAESVPRIHTAVAVRSGLCYNCLGVAFSRAFDLKSRLFTDGVLPLLLSGSSTYKEQRPLMQVILNFDVLNGPRFLPQHFPHDEDQMLRMLRRDGFAYFDTSLQLAALLEGEPTRTITNALDRVSQAAPNIRVLFVDGRNASVSAASASLVERALPRLMPLATSYLGANATYGGLKALRLKAGNISATEYVSGLWHHDRCGRRLKCYIYLQNMTLETHPLRVARRSHETLYYAHDSLVTSRFTEAYVAREYEVVDLLGGPSGGFCFDTNALHTATLPGTLQRDALVFEFHDRAKARSIGRLQGRNRRQWYGWRKARRSPRPPH